MTATQTRPPDLLDAVERIRPIIEEHGPRGETERRLPDEIYDAMIEAGLFRAVTPRAFGGYELGPVELLEMWEAVARIDASAGWNLALNSQPLFYTFGTGQLVEEVFADGPDVVNAGAFFPPGAAVRVDGGWRITGRTRFGSGSNRADWLVMAVVEVEDGQPKLDPATGEPQPMAAVFRKGEVEVIDTWHTLGMRGTGSNDLAAEDVFLPDHRVAPVRPVEQMPPGFEGPLYRVGLWLGVLGESIASLGAAGAAVDKLVDLASAKVPSGAASPLSERQMAQHHAGKARALLEASRAYMHAAANRAYAEAEATGTLSLEAKIGCQLAGCHAAEACAQAVDLVHEAAGTSGVRLESGLDRHLRDAHTLTQHISKSYQRYETVGKLMFGMPADFFLFHV